MTEQDSKELIPFGLEDEAKNTLQDVRFDLDMEPITYREVVEKAGLPVETIPFKELVGLVVTFYGFREFESAYEGQDTALYAAVKVEGDDTMYGTAIGARAVIDFLKTYRQVGGRAPIVAKVAFHEGGKYKGYYTLAPADN